MASSVSEDVSVQAAVSAFDKDASFGLTGLAFLAVLAEIMQLLLLPVLYFYGMGERGHTPVHLLFFLLAIIIPAAIFFCGVGSLLHVVESWLLRLPWVSRQRSWATLFLLGPCLIPVFGCFYFFMLLLFLAFQERRGTLVLSAAAGLLLVGVNTALCWPDSALNRQVNLGLEAYTLYILLGKTVFYLIVLHAVWSRKTGKFSPRSLRVNAICLGLIIGINLGFGAVCWRAQRSCREVMASFPSGCLEPEQLAARYYGALPAVTTGVFHRLAAMPPPERGEGMLRPPSPLPQPDRRLAMVQLWSPAEERQALSAWCAGQSEFFAVMDAISGGRLYKHPRDYRSPDLFRQSSPEHRAYSSWQRLYRLRLIDALGRGDAEASLRLWRFSGWVCASAQDDDGEGQVVGSVLWNSRLDLLELCLGARVFTAAQLEEIQQELMGDHGKWTERVERLYQGEVVRWAKVSQEEILKHVLYPQFWSRKSSPPAFDRQFVAAHFGAVLLAHTYQFQCDLLHLLCCARRQAATWPVCKPVLGRHSGNLGLAILQSAMQMQQQLQLVRQRQAAAIGALAVERYRLEHGDMPESLDRLVPEYLQAVPLDWRQQALHLRQGDFPLFSRRRRGGGEPVPAAEPVPQVAGYQVLGSVPAPLPPSAVSVGERQRRAGFNLKPDFKVLNLKGE